MASDFFYPNTGGVEAHIWQLSQCLVKLGHKVIVITHAYGDRVGIRYLPNNIKVYYLPFLLYPNQNIIWPFLFNTFNYVRQILIREQINIVHGHSAFSPIAHEVMFHAKTLGINTVFTDHSLFGFNYIGARIHKQVVKLSLLQCNHIICVSHVGRKNEALQLKINSDKPIPVSVIPNAVDTVVFRPDPSQRDPNKITIVVNSRLVYRKGIDLLAAVLPKICELNPKVHFIIVGDGPKKFLLEGAVKQFNLHDRVVFLGMVPHDQVRDILVKGDIFLNTSLIEAFCMAIVEAASCGLQVVSTNVGGLPEVLPPNLIKLTEPSVDGLLGGAQLALNDLMANKLVSSMEAHKIIERSYSWQDVAKQTEKVYLSVSKESPQTTKDRLNCYYKSGFYFSFLFIFLIMMNDFLSTIHDWFNPKRDIDVCPSCRAEKRDSALTDTLTIDVNLKSHNHTSNLDQKGKSSSTESHKEQYCGDSID